MSNTVAKFTISLTQERFRALEEARGEETRSAFIDRALGVALSGTLGGVDKPGTVGPPAAVESTLASPRASIEPKGRRLAVVSSSAKAKRGVKAIPRGKK